MDPINQESLKTIEDALFVLCLDDYSVKPNPDFSHQQFFHSMNGRNRWFDKGIQIIVAPNGRAGANGEVINIYLFILQSILLT